MEIFLIIISFICLVAGLIGCIIPALPGPPISYIGLICLHCTDRVEFSTTKLLIWLAVVVVITILDYVIPMLGTKYSQGSKWGTWGAFIGSIIGLFFLPIGLILGPFLGAFIGELLGERTVKQALKSGLGSVLGFLFGTLLKLIICIYFIVEFFIAIF